MPFTFRKSFRLMSGVRFNINRRSVSVTLGGRGGPHYTASSTGRRTTSWNLPGGLGWRKTRARRR
ncbi:DUF4236 domain-containing protein [Streptomyces xanthochromogenes]|uniref:DUF4236 domain-containing protein n=1 Tax=Streptomyces xanthochromogenes TaxID=67384 RepID=UPI00380144A7